MSRSPAGFTLIELMVVISIIGILVAIALPNYIGSNDRARLANVKANAHTAQVLVETYGVDNLNRYPSTVAGLRSAAVSGGYWRERQNPFDETLASFVDYNGTFAIGGVVGYDMSDTLRSKYYLYCADRQLRPVTVNGITHVLSNS
jgi:prepilin-type N-terminal cleavage/methylation domain-containing protein